MLKICSITVLSILLFKSSAKSQTKAEDLRLNIYDSVKVQQFIDSTPICGKINFVERHLKEFVNFKGYTLLILNDISKSSSYPLFIPIANAGIIESEKNKIRYLKEDIIGIKEKLKCD